MIDELRLVGASDTTVSSVATFFLAMAQNPEIQKKSQSAVDRVVEAEGRLPDFTHFQKLPYIEAVVRELLRWKLVAPMGAALFFSSINPGFETKPVLASLFQLPRIV
jgi:cytochrome P450